MTPGNEARDRSLARGLHNRIDCGEQEQDRDDRPDGKHGEDRSCEKEPGSKQLERHEKPASREAICYSTKRPAHDYGSKSLSNEGDGNRARILVRTGVDRHQCRDLSQRIAEGRHTDRGQQPREGGIRAQDSPGGDAPRKRWAFGKIQCVHAVQGSKSVDDVGVVPVAGAPADVFDALDRRHQGAAV